MRFCPPCPTLLLTAGLKSPESYPFIINEPAQAFCFQKKDLRHSTDTFFNNNGRN